MEMGPNSVKSIPHLLWRARRTLGLALAGVHSSAEEEKQVSVVQQAVQLIVGDSMVGLLKHF